jgi:hypothetical protein
LWTGTPKAGQKVKPIEQQERNKISTYRTQYSPIS